jgi:HD-like signal output (HDOD) protein
MKWATPRELVEDAGTLASPPKIYHELLHVLEHPHSSSGDLAAVINDDPGLAARVLKVVNSAFFGFPRSIETVSSAVTVIGTAQIRDLAMATSVMSAFRGISPDLVELESFWLHSLACGAAARAVAVRRGEANAERFFLAGLIHDVGRLVMYLRAPEPSRDVLARARALQEPVWKVEREVFGFDHAGVGRILCEEWRLPPSCIEAVGFHHMPSLAREFPVEAGAVHVGDVVAVALALGNSGEQRVPGFDVDAWRLLGLDVQCTPLLLEDIRGHLNGLAHLLPGRA